MERMIKMNCCKLTMKVWAAAFAVAAGAVLPLGADVTLTENMTLDADADWRDQGVVTITEGVTLNLNGYTLRVSALAGAGSVVDSGPYQILEYIEATGAQKITTDYVPGSATQIDALFAPTDASPLTLFGVRWGNPNFLAMGTGGNWYFFGDGSIISSLTANTLYRFTVGPGTKVSLLDGRTGASLGGNTKSSNLTNTNGGTLSICHVLNNSEKEFFGKHKVYSMKVWHDGALRLDFVPAMNAAGVAGLLDRENGRFYPSETDTAFIAGPAQPAANLRIEAADETALAHFTGTIDDTVGMAIDGACTLAADTDWRRFPSLQIDGTVELAGHDLHLANLRGTGSVGNATSGDAYDRLEYVESTAEQVVDAGVEGNTDTAVELDFTWLANASGTVILGTGKWNGTGHMLAYCPDFMFFGNNATAIYKNEAANTRYIFTTTPGTSPNGTVKLFDQATGSQLASVTRTLANNLDDKELRIFGVGSTTDRRMTKMRVHSCKIWKGGELKRNLVPARDPATQKAGLLDLKSGEFLVSSTGVDLVAGPVVAAAGEAGSLHVEVAEGKANFVDSVNSVDLSGSLELVKEGAGTLVMALAGQTYSGGTRIEAGVLDTLSGYAATKYFLGASGSDIVVGAGAGGAAAVFDFKGNVDYRIYNMRLNGGTLRNGGSDQAYNSGSIGHLTLSADSALEAAFNTTVFHATTDIWNLDTHTLSAEIQAGKTLYFNDPVVITNGVFWTKGDGCWRIVSKAVNMRGATLRAESALWIGGQLDVDDYYAACTFDSNNGTAAMNVYGCFTPATDYFYGCTMQHGSVLDLNGRSGAWSTASAFTAGSNRVTFAPGATVTVDAHARRPWSGKVVDWGEGNAPEGVAFRLDEESKAMGRALSVRADGLYAVSGILMIVR